MKESTRPQKTASNQKSRLPLIASGDMERMAALALATGLNVLPSAIRTRVIHQSSRMVGALWHKTNRGAVRRVRHHLQYLFPDQDNKLESLVRDQLTLSGWNALIANLLPSLRDEHVASLLQIEGLHHVDEIRRRNQPVLLLGFHYGAYGYAIVAALTARGYPTRLVAYGAANAEPARTSYLYRKLYWPRLQRVNRWVQTIAIDPDKQSQPELYETLEKKNELVYLLSDQYFIVPPGQDCPPHLVQLRLLNHSVHVDISGIQLAKQMGGQPLTAIPVQHGHRPRILIEPLEWTSEGTSTADIAQDLQAYLLRLQEHLLEYPAFWRELRRSELLPRLGVFESEESAGE